MCICVTPLSPANTQLLTVCLQKDGPQSRYLTYYSNTVTQRDKGLKKEAMVVPFPHHPDNPAVMLAELPSAALEQQLWTALNNVLPADDPDADFDADEDEETFCNGFAPVVQSGGYKLSIANSFAALKEHINWTEFNVPHNFSDMLVDIQTRFGLNYGFIIAEPYLNSTDQRLGGMFGWVWHGKDAFLPTAHELTAFGPHTVYDVTGIILNDANVVNLAWDLGCPVLGEGYAFYKQMNPQTHDYKPVLLSLNTTELFYPARHPVRYKIALIPSVTDAVRMDFRGSSDTNANLVGVQLPPRHKNDIKII